MDKIKEDIKNIFVELTDNNIDFYIRQIDNYINIDFRDCSSLFTVRDQIKQYIQEVFIMLDDYCKENNLDIEAIYCSKVYGQEYKTLSIDELLDMSKRGLFWKKSRDFFFKVYKKSKIDNFSKFVEKH